jgi:hypothetical protein
MDVPFQNIGSAACWGGGGMLALFVAVGLFFGLKEVLVSLVRGIARRGREGFGVYED